ncbi:21007_t:CDS:2 [Cetraspora pellucida]|uniref:21007_t:CDS:1 n=1 Tax=Cetraspora pellucida TaxID=1433469 RepID=A0A9N9IA88_9GLOM|nr:21007_t:CDS:2 [Cetraspora pellucida]
MLNDKWDKKHDLDRPIKFNVTHTRNFIDDIWAEDFFAEDICEDVFAENVFSKDIFAESNEFDEESEKELDKEAMTTPTII